METIRLELTREQATAVMDAAELLARLHIGQFREITWAFLDRFVTDGKYDAARRERADDLLKQLQWEIFGDHGPAYKTATFERCWAVYTTIRYTLAWHDHPEGGVTVNFDRPLGYGERMPRCVVEEISDDGP